MRATLVLRDEQIFAEGSERLLGAPFRGIGVEIADARSAKSLALTFGAGSVRPLRRS